MKKIYTYLGGQDVKDDVIEFKNCYPLVLSIDRIIFICRYYFNNICPKNVRILQ